MKRLGDPRQGGGKLPLFVVIGKDGKIAEYHAGMYDVKTNEGLAELDGDDRQGAEGAVNLRVTASTSSSTSPFVAIASPAWIVAFPCQSVNVPPASSRIGCRAAASQTFMIGSTITSARPVATSR